MPSPGGTEGSNPSPSSREVSANLTSSIMARARHPPGGSAIPATPRKVVGGECRMVDFRKRARYDGSAGSRTAVAAQPRAPGSCAARRCDRPLDARLISQSGLAKSPCCGFATRSLTGVGGCRHRLFLHAVFDLDPPAIDRSGSLAGNRGNPGRGNHQRDGIAKALNDRGIPTTRGGRRQAVQVQRVLKRAGAATIRDHAG
jgi:hypothetical protein